MKILKFGAPWCGPCKTLEERLADFTACELVRYNVDEASSNDLVDKYNIRNIPSLILLDDNDNEVFRWTGLVSIKAIEAKINEFS
jgi:thioredoxin-like negative regulator of GroEL